MNHTNKVELIGYYGSDQLIAQSAWTSTSRDLTPEKIARIPKLIEDLWTAGHETPFEKGVVHFLVTTDIATHIHFLKHRISSLNAESARYKELKEDKFYLPDDWEGNYLHDAIDPIDGETFAFKGEAWYDVLDRFNRLANTLYHQAVKDLTPTLGRKRAKESARYFKTYSSQITSDVSFNMRSFANFLRLRDSKHAQREVQQVAKQMAKLVLGIEGFPFQHTMAQFGYL